MIKKKIIVIFPNATLCNYIFEILGDFDGDIHCINALEHLKQKIDSEDPACILLYSGLKDSGAVDIYTIIREETLHPSVPILLFSFDTASSEIMKRDSHAAFIRLPSNKEQILLTIDKLLYKRNYILIVDDSKLIHKQLVKVLKEHNYGVLEAYDGKEGIEVLKTLKPDVIISDIEMPVMNGYDFCRHVKENPETEQIPVLILSSLSSGIDIDRGFDAGANDYLTKPVDEEELLDRIVKIISSTTQRVRERILVVDDSRLIRNLIIQGLEQQGFRTFFAVDGKEGLEMARELEPDLITTDYDMPVMNGWELCQQLRKDKKLKDIPVVMLTSRDSRSDRAKSAGTGVKAYLTKPFSEDKLIAIVERVLAEKKIEREKDILKFYVSDAALEAAKVGSMGKSGHAQMRAKEIHATILFSDIASFTPTCEKLTPMEVITLLNEYFDLMCFILKKHDAIIDKFIGDAIMAIFGPGNVGALKAVSAGIEMVNAIAGFNMNRETPVNMRVGINSGKIFIGDIGSKLLRRDFTVIGDSVNVAQRLESNSRTNGVLISDVTYELVKNFVVAEKIGPLKLKGKSEEVYAYNALEVKTPDEKKAKR